MILQDLKELIDKASEQSEMRYDLPSGNLMVDIHVPFQTMQGDNVNAFYVLMSSQLVTSLQFATKM